MGLVLSDDLIIDVVCSGSHYGCALRLLSRIRRWHHSRACKKKEKEFIISPLFDIFDNLSQYVLEEGIVSDSQILFFVYECARCRTVERSRYGHWKKTQAKVCIYNTDTRTEKGRSGKGEGQEGPRKAEGGRGKSDCSYHIMRLIHGLIFHSFVHGRIGHTTTHVSD